MNLPLICKIGMGIASIFMLFSCSQNGEQTTEGSSSSTSYSSTTSEEDVSSASSLSNGSSSSSSSEVSNSDGTSETISSSSAISDESVSEENTMKYVYAHIGDQCLEILLEDNSSASAFYTLLSGGDLTIEMSDYGSFEKVGSIGTDLPRNDTRITTEPGDVILYQGNQITIYYDTNTWTFTRLGKVQDKSQEELIEILGEGYVTVTFSINE